LKPAEEIGHRDAALLVRLGGLGDLLAALPSLRLIREAFPRTEFTLLGRRDYGELFLERGVVDAVRSSDDAAWLSLFREPGGPPDERAEQLSGYALRIGWFLTASAARPFLPGGGSSSPAFPWQAIIYDRASGLSVSRFFFEATRALVEARIRADASFDDYLRLPGATTDPRPRFAVIHPGGGSARKRWPLANFLAIAPCLRERGFSGAVVTGEAEEDLDKALSSAVLPAGWSWSRRPPIADLARRLESTALYIGNDSGVTHLAAACGTEVVALFLAENESAWRPNGRATVVIVEEMNRLSVDHVRAAILRTAGFSPPGELC
jgi:heptosyltransferase-3